MRVRILSLFAQIIITIMRIRSGIFPVYRTFRIAVFSLVILLLAPPGETVQTSSTHVPYPLLVQHHAGIPALVADLAHRRFGENHLLDREYGLRWVQLVAGRCLEEALLTYRAHLAVEFIQSIHACPNCLKPMRPEPGRWPP